VTRLWPYLAAAVTSLAVCAGCTSPAAYRQTVSGQLVLVGGPASASHPHGRWLLRGTVVAQSTSGARIITATAADGRFRVSLPPGRYELTGHSAHLIVDGQQQQCAAGHPILVGPSRPPMTGLQVVCTWSGQLELLPFVTRR